MLVEPRFLFWGDLRVNIPMARPNKPYIAPKSTKKMRLGIKHTQIWPSEHDIVAILGEWLDITGYQDSIHGFWLAHCEFGCGQNSNRIELHPWVWTVPAVFVRGIAKQHDSCYVDVTAFRKDLRALLLCFDWGDINWTLFECYESWNNSSNF